MNDADSSTSLGAADRMAVAFTVNDKSREVLVEARRTLADALREDLGLTGTHLGCEQGVCGACTVLIDGEPVRACLMLAVQAGGSAITTIEGLEGEDGTLHPVQQAFCDHHGLQCGYCTAGMVLTAVHLLANNATPDRETIRQELAGNICRCTGYEGIIDAVASCVDEP